MVKEKYSIREAAKRLEVETHALRYWEEELDLQIPRNEQGRRFYTEANMEQFLQIKALKEQGLQLKAIREILHKENPSADMEAEKAAESHILVYRPQKEEVEMLQDRDLERVQKAKRLQELLKQFISDSIKESNAELLELVKEGLLKELDYQFRLQEERQAEREKQRVEKEDAHFKELDENLRNAMMKGKGRRKKHLNAQIFK